MLSNYNSNPYASSYDPYGGTMVGVSDVIGAQGRFAVSMQKANEMRENVHKLRIENRRRLIEEWKWEQENIPSAEDLRERDMALNYRRSLTNPPLTEILSGKALNDILDHLASAQAKGVRGPSVPLDKNTLKEITVKAASDPGSVGLLKNGGILDWPLPLRTTDFDRLRKDIDTLTPELVRQASAGGVDKATLNNLKGSVDQFNRLLPAKIDELSSAEYIEAKRYVNALHQAVQALGQPDITDYFNKFRARGATVAELVANMKENGLVFAPATPGEEPAYRTLYQAMASYAHSLPQVSTGVVKEKSKE
jgi:hypothetical protein